MELGMIRGASGSRYPSKDRVVDTCDDLSEVLTDDGLGSGEQRVAPKFVGSQEGVVEGLDGTLQRVIGLLETSEPPCGPLQDPLPGLDRQLPYLGLALTARGELGVEVHR